MQTQLWLACRFLWGGQQHQIAFRKALNMRYHFLPHLYSLAHEAHQKLRPIARPASFEFPSDPLGDETYMVGATLLPADVATDNGHNVVPPDENTTVVNLPANETWFAFNSTRAVVGGWTETRAQVPLDEIVVYVRAGGILTLQRDVVQYSDAIGGALEVHVYGGNDGAFTMVEDDGKTTAYLTGGTRVTQFTWDDSKSALSWAVSGAFVGDANSYTTLDAILFRANATAPVRSASRAIGSSGSITF